MTALLWVGPYVASRERDDTAGQQRVWAWLGEHPEQMEMFLFGLLHWAVTAVRSCCGPELEQACARLERVWATEWPPAGSPVLAREVLEAYRLAVPLVRGFGLGGIDERGCAAIDRLMSSPVLTEAGAAGLADVVVVCAWERHGAQAATFIESLHYVSTGSGDPSVAAVLVPEPSCELVAGADATYTVRGSDTALRIGLEQVRRGVRWASTFLCWRDFPVSPAWVWPLVQGLAREPGEATGFLAGLAFLAEWTLREVFGDQADVLMREAVVAGAGGKIADTATRVSSREECAEGMRSASALLCHLLRHDQRAADLLVSRLVQTESLLWGAAIALANVTLEALRARDGSATETVHGWDKAQNQLADELANDQTSGRSQIGCGEGANGHG